MIRFRDCIEDTGGRSRTQSGHYEEFTRTMNEHVLLQYDSTKLTLVFDFSRERIVRTLEIRWPSGTVQVLKDARGDHVLTIKESA